MQPGAAPLLAVAVLLQRVEDLVGELQVHLDTITHVDLWSKLERVKERGGEGGGGGGEEGEDAGNWSESSCPAGHCGFLTLSMRAVFLRPQVSSSCLVVMFLPFPLKPRRGTAWGRSAPTPTHTQGFSFAASCFSELTKCQHQPFELLILFLLPFPLMVAAGSSLPAL